MTTELTYVYAALLDVLGYKYRLQKDRDSASLEFKDSLQRAMSVFSSVNEADFSYQAISDTVIITCPRREGFVNFLGVLKKVALGFLAEGLFIRGGVTYAQHFKSSHVTYSHALARSHELESQLAIYPRIIIDHNIIEMFRVAAEISSLVESNLICELNGVYFLNIADTDNWKTVYSHARSMFERDKAFLSRKEAEFLKHAWFENHLFSLPYFDTQYPRYIPSMGFLVAD